MVKLESDEAARADGLLCAAGGGVQRLLPSGRRWRVSDRYHQELTATGSLVYRCPVCLKAVSWSSRSHHKAFHEGRTFCPRCGRQLASLKNFKKHLQLCGVAPAERETGGAGTSPLPPPAPSQL